MSRRALLLVLLVTPLLTACGGGQLIDPSTPAPSSSIGVTPIGSGDPLPTATAEPETLVTPEAAGAAAVRLAPGTLFALRDWTKQGVYLETRLRLLSLGVDGSSTLVAELTPGFAADGHPIYRLPRDFDPEAFYFLAFDAPAGEVFVDGSTAASLPIDPR